MLHGFWPDSPPPSFEDKLMHLGMTEDEYYEHLKEAAEAQAEAYLDY